MFIYLDKYLNNNLKTQIFRKKFFKKQSYRPGMGTTGRLSFPFSFTAWTAKK